MIVARYEVPGSKSKAETVPDCEVIHNLASLTLQSLLRALARLMNNFGLTIRGVAFRVLGHAQVEAWNSLQLTRSDRRDALGFSGGSSVYHIANS